MITDAARQLAAIPGELSITSAPELPIMTGPGPVCQCFRAPCDCGASLFPSPVLGNVITMGPGAVPTSAFPTAGPTGTVYPSAPLGTLAGLPLTLWFVLAAITAILFAARR